MWLKKEALLDYYHWKILNKNSQKRNNGNVHIFSFISFSAVIQLQDLTYLQMQGSTCQKIQTFIFSQLLFDLN